MTFSTDHGGVAFSCDDAKLSIGASTWNTKLSQLGSMRGKVYIVTAGLVDLNYLSRIIGKRPSDIFIVAHSDARVEAEALKALFPNVSVALHPRNNAKVVLIAPSTVWISSADFGKSESFEAGIGLHSTVAFTSMVENVFAKLWAESVAVDLA